MEQQHHILTRGLQIIQLASYQTAEWTARKALDIQRDDLVIGIGTAVAPQHYCVCIETLQRA